MTFRTGLIAIVVFGLLMFGGVALVTAPEERSGLVAGLPAAPLDPPAPRVTPVPTPSSPPTAAAQPTLPAWADPASRATPRERAVAARPMPARTKVVLSAAIARTRPELRSCFPGDPRRAGRLAPGARRRISGEGRLGTLVLRLQPDTGRFLVADAAVARRGAASEEELGCAVEALRGATLPFPGTVPGNAATMTYPID